MLYGGADEDKCTIFREKGPRKTTIERMYEKNEQELLRRCNGPIATSGDDVAGLKIKSNMHGTTAITQGKSKTWRDQTENIFPQNTHFLFIYFMLICNFMLKDFSCRNSCRANNQGVSRLDGGVVVFSFESVERTHLFFLSTVRSISLEV